MCELVFFIVSVLESDEDAEVVSASYNAHTCPGELGAQLVVAPCGDSFLWTIDVEGRDWRMVGSLLGQVGDSHELSISDNTVGTACGL